MFFESFLLNLSVILILILALIFDYVTKFFSYWYIRHIPYRKPIPFLGSDFRRVVGLISKTDEANVLYAKHPEEKFVGLIKSRIPDLIVRDPNVVKLMLSSETGNFNGRGLSLDKSRDVCLRNNLFYAEGEKWNLLRENFESILKSVVWKFEQRESSVDKYLQQVNGETNVKYFLANVMDGVIKDLFFEKDLDARDKSVLSNLKSEFQNLNSLTRFKSYLKTIFPSVYEFFSLDTLSVKQVNDVTDLIEKSILKDEVKKINTLLPTSKNKLRLDKNLENDYAFTLLSCFISEGIIPCMNVTTCLIYELSRQPEYQEKCRKEGDYLDYCIKESLRLYSPYSIVQRKCIKTFKQFPDREDLLIDRGIGITIPVQAIHRDEKYYKDANKFNPNRFFENSQDKVEESSYMPFGNGPRRCIGEDLALRIIKAVTKSILNKYQIETTSRTKPKLHFIDHNFMRIPTDDVWLRFVPIKANGKTL